MTSGLQQLMPCPFHPASHPRRKIGAVIVFQQLDEFARNITVSSNRAKPPERWRIGNRIAGQGAIAMVDGERCSKDLAIGPLNESDPVSALGTQAAVQFGDFMAAKTGAAGQDCAALQLNRPKWPGSAANSKFSSWPEAFPALSATNQNQWNQMVQQIFDLAAVSRFRTRALKIADRKAGFPARPRFGRTCRPPQFCGPPVRKSGNNLRQQCIRQPSLP